MLVQRSDMAQPAFGEPPESTTLPTTKECEASSIWEKVEDRGASLDNCTEISFQKELILTWRQYLTEIILDSVKPVTELADKKPPILFLC